MSVRERPSKKKPARAKAPQKKASSKASANGAGTRGASGAGSRKPPTAKKAPAKKAAKRSASGAPARRARAQEQAPSPEAGESTTAAEPTTAGTSGGGLLPPKQVRRSREDKAWAEARLDEIDSVMSAWADILAERMVADQTFSEIVEQLEVGQPRDLRGLFLWEALHAAESHVALITEVIATHLDGRKADPLAILADLRDRRRRIAAVYAVNAFLAVLNQMKPNKPKWLQMGDVDPRFAVLALAHQTLNYAAEAVQADVPPDLTDLIIGATQDDAVWVWRRMPEPGTDTLAACAAAAAFFRLLEADVLTTTDEVAADYAAHGRDREAVA